MTSTKPLAEYLGGTAHLSPLLRKAARAGFATPEILLHLAVKRGCTHYTPPDYEPTAVIDPGAEALSNAELAIAFISAAQVYHPQLIRCASQLLGSAGIIPGNVVRLAIMERCVPVLHQIAQAALRIDREYAPFWQEILDLLPPHPPVRPGVLPHPSRYTLQTGILPVTESHRPKTVWLRPQPAG